jgi:uncharacterized membrane protein YdbT with pleckstrin-like domain
VLSLAVWKFKWDVRLLWLSVFPLLWAFWRWLDVRSTHWELTTERLRTTRGIFTKTTEALELYRVRDQSVVQPLTLRLFGLENIRLTTADASTPIVILSHIPKSLGLGEHFRENVERCRMAKRVREVDVDGPNDFGDAGAAGADV